MFCLISAPILILGTLRIEDGEGSKNVAEKVNSRSKSLTLSNVGNPS